MSGWIIFSYRKSVVEPALPEVELGEEGAPLVRELGHLPPDALGCLLLVCGDGRAPGGALSLAGHCNGHSQGRCQMTAPGHTVLLPGFVRLNGYVATESSEGTQSCSTDGSSASLHSSVGLVKCVCCQMLIRVMILTVAVRGV